MIQYLLPIDCVINLLLIICNNKTVNTSMGSISLPKFTSLAYDHDRKQESAIELVLRFRPEWKYIKDKVEIIEFTDGKTNTVKF